MLNVAASFTCFGRIRAHALVFVLLAFIGIAAADDSFQSVDAYSDISIGDEQEEVASELIDLGIKLVSVRRRGQIVIREEDELDRLREATKIIATDYRGISANIELEDDSVAESRVSYSVPQAIAKKFQSGCSREEVFDGLIELFRATDDLVVFDEDPLRDSSYIDLSKHSFSDSGLANYELWNFNVYDEPGNSHRVELEFSDKNGILISIKVRRIPGP